MVDTPRPMAPARIPPEVAELAEQLLAAQRQVLDYRLLGLYLFGSATTGSFQAGISDIDTLAVLATDPSAHDLAGLATMHERLIKDAPAWYDRVEVDYLSATALANFRTGSWPATTTVHTAHFPQRIRRSGSAATAGVAGSANRGSGARRSHICRIDRLSCYASLPYR